MFLSLFFRGHRSRAPKKKELKEDDEDGFDEMEEAIEAANAADLAEIEAETAKKPKRYFFHLEDLSSKCLNLNILMISGLQVKRRKRRPNTKVETKPTLKTSKVLKVNRQKLLRQKRWRQDLKSSQLRHLKSPSRISKCLKNSSNFVYNFLSPFILTTFLTMKFVKLCLQFFELFCFDEFLKKKS